MHDFVTIGTVIGSLLCLIHAAYLTKVVGSGRNTATMIRRSLAVPLVNMTRFRAIQSEYRV